MSYTLEVVLPEDLKHTLAARVSSEEHLPRWVLEAIAIEAYREGLISRGKLGEILGLPFHEREAFLAQRDVPYNYGPEDLDEDARTLQRVMET